MNPLDLQTLASAALVPARPALVSITDKPAPVIDPEALAEILADMKCAAARLRGVRCELSDKRAAAALDRARLDLIELLTP